MLSGKVEAPALSLSKEEKAVNGGNGGNFYRPTDFRAEISKFLSYPSTKLHSFYSRALTIGHTRLSMF